jgi:hypothetical protein
MLTCARVIDRARVSIFKVPTELGNRIYFEQGGPETYYFTDEDGNVHSREFLAQELIPEKSEIEGSPKRKPSGKLQKLKPGAVDIISLVRPDEAQQQMALPASKSGAPPEHK